MELKKPNPNGERRFRGSIVPALMLTTALLSAPGFYYAGNQQGQQEGYASGQREGYASGQQKGYEKGQQDGYASGYNDGHDKGTNETIRYSDNNVKDGMNYGLQRQYDKARQYFINLYENKDKYKMNDQEFENNANELIQSIKMLFRNKADIFAQDEEKDGDSLKFAPDKITYGIGGGQRVTYCEFSDSTPLQRFSARISRLVDALKGKRIDDVYYELGGIALDIPMRFLRPLQIFELSNGNIAFVADPDFDKWENENGNEVVPVYQPTVQAVHKHYEASKLIEGNKTAKYIRAELNPEQTKIDRT